MYLMCFSKHIGKSYLDKIELKQTNISPKSDLSLLMRLNYFSNYFNNDYLKDSDFENM
jgi:DNA phosphorothioation-dependent restriction protein DptF